MDFAQYVLLGAVVAGITEFFKRLRLKDWWGALTIIISALVGLGFGFAGIEGLTPLLGIAAGLGTSGAITTAGELNKRNI